MSGETCRWCGEPIEYRTWGLRVTWLHQRPGYALCCVGSDGATHDAAPSPEGRIGAAALEATTAALRFRQMADDCVEHNLVGTPEFDGFVEECAAISEDVARAFVTRVYRGLEAKALAAAPPSRGGHGEGER